MRCIFFFKGNGLRGFKGWQRVKSGNSPLTGDTKLAVGSWNKTTLLQLSFQRRRRLHRSISPWNTRLQACGGARSASLETRHTCAVPLTRAPYKYTATWDTVTKWERAVRGHFNKLGVGSAWSAIVIAQHATCALHRECSCTRPNSGAIVYNWKRLVKWRRGKKYFLELKHMQYNPDDNNHYGKSVEGVTHRQSLITHSVKLLFLVIYLNDGATMTHSTTPLKDDNKKFKHTTKLTLTWEQLLQTLLQSSSTPLGLHSIWFNCIVFLCWLQILFFEISQN